MNRIEEKMTALKNEGRKAFITYTTAGLPDMETTKKIMFAQQEAGIDVMELGIPFSDPVADGPVIQAASYEAIQKGATLTKIFTLMKEVRKEGLTTPVVFMMYYNTVYHYGLEEFVEMCADCGVDGLIIPDLPYEEQKEINAVLAENEAAPIVYCVSQMGVTGNGANFHKQIREYLLEVKKNSPVPVMMGFGIRTAGDVEPLEDIIDGAIVGSHFITLMKENNYDENVIKEYISSFKKEMNE